MTQNPTVSINPADLVAMDTLSTTLPLFVDVVYAGGWSFCGPIYRSGARLWLHQSLADVVARAAHLAGDAGCGLILWDGLRTVEAQAAMLNSPIVRANPQWMTGEHPLFSRPGGGGHPRGMAVDLSLTDAGGAPLDMGTPFDFIPVDGTGPDVNPAHRQYKNLSPDILARRAFLEKIMMDAADACGLPLHPLTYEWWDFRFPADDYNKFLPIHDADLPPHMRMT